MSSEKFKKTFLHYIHTMQRLTSLLLFYFLLEEGGGGGEKKIYVKKQYFFVWEKDGKKVQAKKFVMAIQIFVFNLILSKAKH